MGELSDYAKFRMVIAKVTITYARIQIVRYGMPECIDTAGILTLDAMFREWAETVQMCENKPAGQVTTADLERMESILTAQEEWLYQPALMDALKHLAPDYAPGHLRLPEKEPD